MNDDAVCPWCDHPQAEHHWMGYCKLCFCWGKDPRKARAVA